ncbi:MAG: MbcA/ParS/Xre antitoxin family protein [Gammaproteobacteria bacterium]|nr:MbcA/ParS/Xre antitoxin family protein [Gammaproteobacteria bacterium]MDH5731453.1 MbcA/ParS/Xre antitoxin family protein [Gammaproteobacteria bacterium]
MQRESGKSAIDLQKVAGPTLRTLFNIFKEWGLTDRQVRTLLGDIPRQTFHRWKQDPNKARISYDTLERASYLFGIYKALQILLPNISASSGWFYRENTAPPFGGRPPIERMMAGNVADLYDVRQFLDAARGVSV